MKVFIFITETEDGFTVLFVKKKEDNELEGDCKEEEEEEEDETFEPPVKNIRHLMKVCRKFLCRVINNLICRVTIHYTINNEHFSINKEPTDCFIDFNI